MFQGHGGGAAAADRRRGGGVVKISKFFACFSPVVRLMSLFMV